MHRPALLFDLDGTLLDSDPLHIAAFADLFAARGRSIDRDFYLDRIHGRHNLDIFGEFFPGEDAGALADAKEAAVRNRLDGIAPTDGAAALIDRARGAGWGVAVVTNAPRENAEAMLAAIGFAAAFDTLVIGDECARGKPSPDPYARATAQLNATPAAAIAFEDSPSGLASARAAGVTTVIGLRSSLGDGALRAAGADASIADFADPALIPYLDRLQGAAA